MAAADDKQDAEVQLTLKHFGIDIPADDGNAAYVDDEFSDLSTDDEQDEEEASALARTEGGGGGGGGGAEADEEEGAVAAQKRAREEGAQQQHERRINRMKLRALRAAPVVVAMAQYDQLQSELPTMSMEQLAARAPELARHLSAFVVGWSGEGVLVRSSAHATDRAQAIQGIKHRADELVRLERELQQAAAGAGELEDDEECSEEERAFLRQREREEGAKIAEAVSSFLSEEVTLPKTQREQYNEASLRRAVVVADDHELDHFFCERSSQAERELAQERKRNQEREAIIHPLFKRATYRPAPLDFDEQDTVLSETPPATLPPPPQPPSSAASHAAASAAAAAVSAAAAAAAVVRDDQEVARDEGTEPADGKYSALRPFIANRKLCVRGVGFVEDRVQARDARCPSEQQQQQQQMQQMQKEERQWLEEDDEEDEEERERERQLVSNATSAVDEAMGVDMVDWEDAIVWDADALAQRKQEQQRLQKRVEDARYFEPPVDYVNPHLESDEWVHSIAWDASPAVAASPALPVMYDLNDPNVYFQDLPQAPPQAQAQAQAQAPTTTEATLAAIRAAAMKDRPTGATMHLVSERPACSAECYLTRSGQVDELVDKTFNVSYDNAYASNTRQRQMRQRSGTSVVNHGRPALTLLVFPVHMQEQDFANFHRPKLTESSVRKAKAAPAPVLLGNPAEHPLAKNPQKMKHISAMTGGIVLVEHLEKDPTLVSYVAMGSRLHTYYRKQSEEELALPQGVQVEGELVLLEPSDTSPFAPLGEVRPGRAVHALENKMVKMPLARHEAAETDFLLVQTEDGRWCIRELGPVFLAGQEFPQMEIPAPGSNLQKKKQREWLEVYMERTFKNSQVHALYTTQQFVDAFQLSNSSMVSGIMQRYCTRGGGVAGTSSTYEVNPKSQFHTEEQLLAMITPEDLCAYNASMHGVWRLREEGITHTFYPVDIQRLLAQCAEQLKQDDREALEQMVALLSVTPWTVSTAYCEFLRTGREAIKFFGQGAPLVRVEGFSLAPNPSRSTRKHGEPPPPPQKAKHVANTDRDLRRMNKERAIQLLVARWGYDEQELLDKRRKELVEMVKACAKEDGDSDFSRALVPNREKSLAKQKEWHQLFDNMLLAIASPEPPPGAENPDPDLDATLDFLRTLGEEAAEPDAGAAGAGGAGGGAGGAGGAGGGSSPAPTTLEQLAQSPEGSSALSKMKFTGSTRNQINRPAQHSAPKDASMYHGNRWHPKEEFVPLVSMRNKSETKRGRPRKHPLPDGAAAAAASVPATPAGSAPGTPGTPTAAIAQSVSTTALMAPSAAAAAPALSSSSPAVATVASSSSSAAAAAAGGEPPAKRARTERGRRGRRAQSQAGGAEEVQGVTIDGVVFPLGTPKPSAAALLARLRERGELLWSDAFADEVAALAPLERDTLLEVCRRRCSAPRADGDAAEALYSVCWAVAEQQTEQAAGCVLEELVARGPRDNERRLRRAAADPLRCVLVHTHTRLRVLLAAADYEPAAAAGAEAAAAADDDAPAECEALAVLGEADKLALQDDIVMPPAAPAHTAEHQRRHGRGRKAAVTSAAAAPAAAAVVKRPRAEEDSDFEAPRVVVVPAAKTAGASAAAAAAAAAARSAPPPAKRARAAEDGAQSRCDAAEDALRQSGVVLPPRDDQAVVCFVVRISKREHGAGDQQTQEAKAKAPAKAAEQRRPVLVHLVYPPPPSRAPHAPPQPAAAAAAAKTPSAAAEAKAKSRTPKQDKAAATPPLKINLASLSTASTSASSSSSSSSTVKVKLPPPRRSGRAPHPTERFGDLVATESGVGSSSGSSGSAASHSSKKHRAKSPKQRHSHHHHHSRHDKH